MASGDWIKAEYDSVANASFLTAGASSANVRPAITTTAIMQDLDAFTVRATVVSVGAGADTCDIYFAYGPTGTALPHWSRVSVNRTAGATATRPLTGLVEGANYDYAFMASNNLGRTYVTAGEPFSYAIDGLTPATTYYWCLEARDSAGVAVASQVGSFATMGSGGVNLIGSNIWLVVEGGSSFGSRVGNCTKDGGIRLDDGTVSGTFFRTDYNWNATTNEWYVFSGAAPRLTATQAFRNGSAEEKDLRLALYACRTRERGRRPDRRQGRAQEPLRRNATHSAVVRRRAPLRRRVTNYEVRVTSESWLVLVARRRARHCGARVTNYEVRVTNE